MPESSIARESDVALPIHAGTEIGVASTKAFTCQLTVLLLLALKAAHDRGVLDADTLADHLSQLRALPAAFNTRAGRLGADFKMAQAARKLAEARDVLFLGRGLMYPLALEGALKLKEISYIHAEAYASGELKHGPIALIDKHVPVVVMAPARRAFRQDRRTCRRSWRAAARCILVTDKDAAGARRRQGRLASR